MLANEFEAWLDKMATRPLPGGVAAAALAAAMGAALGAKVAGSEQLPPAPGRGAGRSPVALADAAWGELVGLAVDDEAAYRRVLDTRHLPDNDQARRQAWQRATELPLSLAEACRRLLAELPRLDEVGSPGVAVDLEIGRRLLAAGAEAGLLATRENLRAWGTHPDAAPYARRLATMTEEEGI